MATVGVVMECVLCCQMDKYPRLRDETERILTTYLREQEEKTKDHVRTSARLCRCN